MTTGTLSDAEIAAMWPRVPNATCLCGYRGECTWSTAPPRLLCDGCRWVLFGSDDEPMPVLRADIETGGST